jgi:nitroimidazol reductase NimA-like FMN-containing flavoprotein (pyridoxamine 5'-phosphate oxidase superfamily)
MKMRKANREIKNQSELIAILNTCDACRLGLSDHGMPYVVPLNFGYEYFDDGNLVLYFHCASEGRKLDIIAENPNVCFEMDCSHELKPGDTPCEYSMNYESIIGSGQIVKCAEKADKIHGLTQIMRKYSDKDSFEFPDKILAITTVLKLRVDEYVGKRLQK